MTGEQTVEPFSALNLQIDYAGELNEQQLAAVTGPPGPALVIAGAGSGKTRTLTYRVAFLLEQGIPPERILLLTFTNKAAAEMMRRVAELLGQELPTLWGGTFHSIGNRVLRQHAKLLGYQRDFSILDREDARHLIATCVSEAGIDVKGTEFPKAEDLGEIFSLATNTQKSARRILDEQFREFSLFAKEIMDIQQRYAARKLATNAMDFDDLLALWLKLMQEQPEVCEVYQRRFQFILVDEYQDTNKLQSDLIDLLGARHHNVMVVGDDAQGIYAWRGANHQNILKFPERYPEATLYKIETNYRSTPEILDVANAAITANIQQFPKELAAARKTGMRPVLVVCMDAAQQAAFVGHRALQLREGGTPLNRMAVLYRSHFHVVELQLELTRRQIPFTITSGIRFFEQAHIKDVAAYLKLVLNPRDELSFKRVVQLLPGVGGKGAEKLWAAFAEAGGQTQEVLPLPQKLEACAGIVPKKAADGWSQLAETLAQLEAKDVRGSASQMIRLVIEAGYEDFLKEHFANHASRREDLEALVRFARQFSTLEDFLTQLALLSNVEAENDRPASEDDEKLRLSTIHQAKGLEFDVVFLIMLCEGLFPAQRSLETPEGEAEERRLMYVAITRARNELYISYPLLRSGFGDGGASAQQPSRFLKEIPDPLWERCDLRTWS